MRLAWLVVATLAFPSASFADSTPSSEAAVSQQTSLQDAAVQLGHRYDALYRLKDAVGMAGLYAPDGELVSPAGKLIKGREALVTYYRKRFESGAFGHKIVVLEFHAIGNSGYSVSDFSVQAPVAGQPSKSHLEEGHIAAIYAHDQTGWHFALVEPSVTPPKGG